MRYHLCRRKFWDTCNRANRILGALSGSAVIIGLTAKIPSVTAISAVIVAVFSTLDLVFDFSERARNSDDLYRQWSLFAQEISVEQPTTRSRLAELRQRRLKIEMEEAPSLDLLERRCCYDEAKARALPIDEAWKLTRNERRFAQFVFWRSAKR